MNSWADQVEMAGRMNVLGEYLTQFFPGRFGIGFRRPMGRTFKRMGNQGERPKVVVGHSYVDRIGRADSPDEGDRLEVNWLGFAGASMQQLLTIVYEMIEGEYKYLSSQFVVVGWENSVLNGLTLDEAEAIINGVVEEQRGISTHKIILAECAMSPRIIKLGKSQVAFRINRMVKEAARRTGAHRLDLERSVGKVDARKEVVGVKPNMWEERGTDGYHPSDIGAGRMAAWIRNYFRHGMDSTDPAYPPKRPKEGAAPSASLPSSAEAPAQKPEEAQGRKLTRRELLEELKRARSLSKSSDEDKAPQSKKRNEELVMDTDEEMEVDKRAQRVLEPEGDDLSGISKVVPDLITIDEDPLEGPSQLCMVPELAHVGGSAGSLASSAGAAWTQKVAAEEEDDLATLESYFEGARGLIRGINATRRRMRDEGNAGAKLQELQRDYQRKRARLSRHLRTMNQVALEAAHLSADSSSSSSDSEPEGKAEKKAKDTSYQKECRRLARTMNSIAKARKAEKRKEKAEKEKTVEVETADEQKKVDKEQPEQQAE